MKFEWDDQKNESNLRKHGIFFEDAIRVFEDLNCLTYLDRVEEGEERWHAIGVVEKTLLFLLVVHTYKEQGTEEIVRIISARRANNQEKIRYVAAIL